MKTYTGKEWVEKMKAKTYTAEDFKKWGAQGGEKSKRVLTTAQAKAMVAARERKRRKTQRALRRANADISRRTVENK